MTARRRHPVPLAVVALLVASSVQAQSAQPAAPAERVGEIRVHGNATMPDADVVRLAGIAVGDPLTVDSVLAIEERLRRSGRFESVEVRKRSRAIDGGDVALILLVHEHPGAAPGRPVPGLGGRVSERMMFMPILEYTEAYGFTYGLRSSTQDLLGAGERLSGPVSWGGVRRIAIEVERTFKTGPLTRVLGSAGLSQREHPRDDVDDRRSDLRARAERVLWGRLRIGGETGRTRVTFGGDPDRFWTYGADLTFDTRDDPAFPGNAILASVGWTSFRQPGREALAIRRADVRAFRRLVGQSVLALRVAAQSADRPLPRYERLLLGGGSTVRGYRVGAFDGDQTLATSAELRVPFGSPLNFGKTGVSLFVDAGAAAEAHQRLGDARFHRGYGAGVFFQAPLFRINLDVARNGDGGHRVHVAAGFTF